MLAFKKVGELPEVTWPDGLVPQQLHVDTTVPATADLDVQHERALALGTRVLKDRSDDRRSRCRSTPTLRGTRFASLSDPAGLFGDTPFRCWVAARA